MLRTVLFIALAVIAGLAVITWRGHSEKARGQALQRLPIVVTKDGPESAAAEPIAQQGGAGSTIDGSAAVANRPGPHGVAPEQRQRPVLRPNRRVRSRTDTDAERERSTSDRSAASTRPPLPEHRLERFFNAHEIELANRDRVLASLGNYDAELFDIYELSRSRGLSVSDRLQLENEAFGRLSSGLHELLGRDLTSDLFAFQVGQQLTDGFAAECASRGIPLSDVAFTTITLDFHRHCLVSQPSNPALADRWPEMMRQHDELGLAIAEKVLSPQQMIEFRKFWTQRGLGYVHRR